MNEHRASGAYPAVVLVLGAVLTVSGAATSGARTPEAGIGAAAAAGGLGILAWWITALALALGTEVLRRQGQEAAARRLAALTPGSMRRLAAALLGLNLLAGTTAAPAAPPGAAGAQPASAPGLGVPGQASSGAAVPALAGPGRTEAVLAVPVLAVPVGAVSVPAIPAAAGSTAPADEEERVSPNWKPLPLPCNPGLLARPPRQEDATAGSPAAGVVVRSGDSLWSIAAARLGPLATDTEVAGSWPRWYSRNASVIGPEPDRLTPGQILVAPDPP
ncbi:LysM peptidoglycan-binding domain-containing protein [Arthrobacter sp. TMN-37]